MIDDMWREWSNKLKVKLTKLSEDDALSDSEDFSPYDASGANSDDCFNMGIRDGQIFLARELLGEFFDN